MSSAFFNSIDFVFYIFFLCLVDCQWGTWNSWESTCTKSCGEGSQMRTRGKQQLAQDGGTDCPGSDQESKSCNPQPCPGKKYCTFLEVHSNT